VQATDSNGTGSATLTVNVTGANDTPALTTPTAASYTDTSASDTFTNTTGTLAGSDRDTGATLTYGITSGTGVAAVTTGGSDVIGAITYDVKKVGIYGTLYVKSTTGDYVFVPSNSGVNGVANGVTPSDTFTMSTSDGTTSTTQTYTVNVTGANDKPVIINLDTDATQIDAADPLTNYIDFQSGNGADVDDDNASLTGGYITFTRSTPATADGDFYSDIADAKLGFGIDDLHVSGTIVGSDKVFVDVGSGWVEIGSVHSTLNGQDGANLTINFITTDATPNGGGIAMLLQYLKYNATNSVAHTFSVVVNDGALTSDPVTFSMTPDNSAPTVAHVISDQNASVSSAFSYQFASNTFADADTGNTLTYTAQLVDGSGNLVSGGALPSWLTFTAGTRTFSGTPTSGDTGTIHLKVTATDNGTGTLSVFDSFDLTVSNAPTVSSLNRAVGSDTTTNANSLNFTLVFSEAVTGVDVSDFALATTGTATGTIGTPTTSDGGVTWTIPVTSITGDGALGLDLNATGTSIQNGSSVAISGGYTGQTFTIDNTAPTTPTISSSATGNDSTPTLTGTADANSTVSVL
jgi:VCBS repeat-containing protein